MSFLYQRTISLPCYVFRYVTKESSLVVQQVKDLALSLLRLLLCHRFYPWPWNFHMPQAQPKKKKKRRDHSVFKKLLCLLEMLRTY